MNSLRVLHVDDEPDIREVVEMSLGLDPDLTVRSCPSGADALATSAHWPPDLILLDVMMPCMDGPTTLQRLRESPPTTHTPIVFMTARAQAREIESFVALGAVGVIPKPFDPMTLAGAVRGFLRPSSCSVAMLRRGFMARARNDAAMLLSLRAEISTEARSAAALGRIKETAHGLAGAGGIFGYPLISATARSLAQAIDELLKGIGAVQTAEKALDELLVRIERE